MNELLIFALLFVAISIGWFLGRRSNPVLPAADDPGQYYRGLNYLLDGRQDGAVDAFISALEVNSETLETHVALGNLLRKKGEVDRAIRIHQNLLGRPSLPRSQVHQAHLELARDYISAGLLDRAERLLLDLVQESTEQRSASLNHLLEIYQSERDWQRAIDIAGDLLPRKSARAGGEGERGRAVAVALSHYHCELAAEKLQSGEIEGARKLLRQILSRDRHCVRASLMLGELECDSGNFKAAVKALRKVRDQDPELVPETVPLLRRCYRELGSEGSLRGWLEECLGAHPSPELVLAVADVMQREDGVAAAGEFLARELAERPSMRGLAQLLNLRVGTAQGRSRDELEQLQAPLARLLEQRPTYRCVRCGFSGHQLHWCCPGCQQWSTVRSIRGAPRD